MQLVIVFISLCKVAVKILLLTSCRMNNAEDEQISSNKWEKRQGLAFQGSGFFSGLNGG